MATCLRAAGGGCHGAIHAFSPCPCSPFFLWSTTAQCAWRLDMYVCACNPQRVSCTPQHNLHTRVFLLHAALIRGAPACARVVTGSLCVSDGSMCMLLLLCQGFPVLCILQLAQTLLSRFVEHTQVFAASLWETARDGHLFQPTTLAPAVSRRCIMHDGIHVASHTVLCCMEKPLVFPLLLSDNAVPVQRQAVVKLPEWVHTITHHSSCMVTHTCVAEWVSQGVSGSPKVLAHAHTGLAGWSSWCVVLVKFSRCSCCQTLAPHRPQAGVTLYSEPAWLLAMTPQHCLAHASRLRSV